MRCILPKGWFWFVFLGIPVLIGTVFFFYFRTLQSDIDDSTRIALDEVLQQQKLAIAGKLEGGIATLQSMSTQLAELSKDNGNVAKSLAMLDTSANAVDFAFFVVADRGGIGIASNGREVDIGGQDYFKRAVTGDAYMSDVPSPFASSPDNTLFLVIATPVYAEDHTVVAVMAGFLDFAAMDGEPTSSFDGKGRAYICTSAGRIVANSEARLLFGGENLADVISRAQAVKYDDATMVLARMRKGESGHSAYILDGHRQLMHYAPLGIGDWYIVSIAQYDVVSKGLNRTMSETILAVCVAVVFLAGFFLFYVRPQGKIQERLDKLSERTEIMFSACPISCMFWNRDKGIIDANAEAIRMFEADSKDDLLGDFSRFHPEYQPSGESSRSKASEIMERAFSEGLCRFEWMHQTKKGEPLPVEVTLIRVRYEGDDALVAYGRDLREQQAMLAEIDKMLHKAEQDERCFRQLAAYSRMAVVEWKEGIEKVRVYETLEDLFSKDIPEHKDYNDIVGDQMIHPDDREAHRRLLDDVIGGKTPQPIKLRLLAKSGEYRWCYHPVVMVLDDSGKPYKAIGFFEDINEFVLREESLRQKSQMDMLTRLYNKEAVKLLVDDALNSLESLQKHAVVCVDLDNFKSINDTFGHLFGDEVLIEISGKIKKLFRFSDVLGRFGGDEFVLFIRNIPNLEFVQGKIDHFCRIVEKTYRVGDVTQTISASIGVAIYPDDGTCYDELYKKADEASYEVKRNGKNGYRFYSVKPGDGGDPIGTKEE